MEFAHPTPGRSMTITLRQETTQGSECYIAWHPGLPAVLGQGDTPEVARESLAEATELVAEHYRERGLKWPEWRPSQTEVRRAWVTVTFEGRL